MLRPIIWLRSSSCLAKSQVALAAASVHHSTTCSSAQTGSQTLDSIGPLGIFSKPSGLSISSSHVQRNQPTHGDGEQPQQQQSHIQQLQQASTAINSSRGYLQQQQLRGLCCSAASLHTFTAGDAGSPPGGQLDAASSSSSRAAEQSKAITRLIRNASSVQQLQALIQQHQASFNAINVAAAFTRAQALIALDQGQQNHQQQQLTGRETAHAAAVALPPLLQQQLTDLWLQQLHAATPRELANVLLASSKLSMFDPQVWGSSLAVLLQDLDSTNDQDASSAVYALATAAAANRGGVPGFTSHELQSVALTLFGRVHQLATTVITSSGPDSGHSDSSSSSEKKSSKRRFVTVGPQAISSTLWSLARLGVQPPKQQLVELLRALAKPRVLGIAEPLALVNTFWALSELQQLPGWGPRVDGVRASLGTAPGEMAGNHGNKIRQPPIRILPNGLLSEHECGRLAGSSPQAVSNTILALSRFATGPQPHLLGVPAAQACIEQLLKGPTAADISKWNAQDVGNAVYAVAQVGAIEPAFMQAVLTSAPQWLAQAGPATVAQVALGFARLKLRHATDLLEALVLRGKYLLLQHQHHGHGHSHSHSHSQTQQQQPPEAVPEARDQASSSGSGGSSGGSMGDGAWQQEQQQQHMCECLATDLSWSIAVLNQMQLAKEVQELIRVSGIKQESYLHTKNARRLWTVHAWLVRHKLAGGHGLQRLLTEQQLADCAAANRHVHRLTPPSGLQ